jgi:hypothetical protein
MPLLQPTSEELSHYRLSSLHRRNSLGNGLPFDLSIVTEVKRRNASKSTTSDGLTLANGLMGTKPIHGGPSIMRNNEIILLRKNQKQISIIIASSHAQNACWRKIVDRSCYPRLFVCSSLIYLDHPDGRDPSQLPL